LQLAFDCGPWAPTLPDDFVVVPNEIRQVGAKIGEAFPIRQTKNNPAGRESLSRNSGKIPDFVKNDERPTQRKNPSGAAASDGKVNVVAAQRRRLKCITAHRNGKTARFGRENFPAEELCPE
jgi:hypothetical protein